MIELGRHKPSTRRLTWLALLMAGALGIAFFLIINHGALAEDDDATPVPVMPALGDCYGGVLSHAPLHCYALEQAEDAEIIDVDSIYQAGSRLYIFVGGQVGAEIRPVDVEWGNPTVGVAVYRAIAQKMEEFARLWPSSVQRDLLPYYPAVCETGDSPADCLIRKVDFWVPSRGVEHVLDSLESYDSLRLMAGTGEGRTSVRGWAGWTKLWPATQAEGGKDTSGASGAQRQSIPTSFDISDVDTSNFPELDCSLAQPGHENACDAWWGGVQDGIDSVVGVHQLGPHIGRGKLYIQLKRDPDDLKAFERDKAKVLRLKPADWQSQEWVIIPVKYGFPELWKWGVILDRFADSRGNTIGIVTASAYVNSRAVTQSHEIVIYPEAGPGPAWGQDQSHASLLRETIVIYALDAHLVEDALPVLLLQLGIPIDAVGVIIQERQKADYLRPTSSNVGDAIIDADEQSPDRSQPNPADTDKVSVSSELSGESEPAAEENSGAPSSLVGLPETAADSVFPAWAIALVVIGAMASTLASVVLIRRRLRRSSS